MCMKTGAHLWIIYHNLPVENGDFLHLYVSLYRLYMAVQDANPQQTPKKTLTKGVFQGSSGPTQRPKTALLK